MKFRIPFTLASLDKLKKRSKVFRVFTKNRKFSRLNKYLVNLELDINPQDYMTICFRGLVTSFLFLFLISSTILVLVGVASAFLLAFGISFLFSLFVFFSQIAYLRVYDQKRVMSIDRNLIPALDDMLIQLNSGAPLFNIMVNISNSNYGVLSVEFKKAVKKINAGFPQISVLEEIGEKNSSLFFRRTLWQISNGMRAGSDISVVIEESIKSLNDEQLLEIQTYGNKLNPLVMFYMLISVILPALSITFLTILSSMISLSDFLTMVLFFGMFVFTVLIQIMFLGMIKSVRPRLL